jgi:hypothetical protein
VGGLIGRAVSASGTISHSYSVGLVTGSGSLGGFVGRDAGGAYTSDYWDVQSSGQSIDGAPSGTTGLTTAQLKAGLPSGFDPTVWGINASINTGYPYLLWQTVPPVAVNESVTTTANTPVAIDLTAGASGKPTSAALVGTPVGGAVAGFPATTVTFTPTKDFTGAASFQFTLANASGTSNTATATITVKGVAPTAAPETAATTANTPVTIDLTAGASGNPTSAAQVGTPVGGTVTGFPATTVTFTPNKGFTGAASFQFTLANAYGTSNTATAAITVTLHPPPVAVNETASTTAGTPVTIDLSAGASGNPRRRRSSAARRKAWSNSFLKPWSLTG